MRPRAARPRLTLEALECRTTPSAGDLDLTFSDDGEQVLNLTPGVPDQAQGVVIQPDGKIVVVGAARSTLTDTVGVLIRLNADGSLDETFDGDGIAWLDLPGYDAEVFRAVALQADGKIVVTGDTAWGGPSLVTRFHTDGSLDTTFGTDGVALTSMISFAVAIQADGKVVIAGSHYDGGSTLTFSFAAARFNADGTPDEVFGVNGMTLALTGDAGALDVLVQPDGKILMGGRSGHGYGPFALVRLNPDGGFDTTFDGDGVVTTGSGFVEENAGIRGLALDADGKIVATGVAQDWAIVVASVLRYNPDGSLDTTFGDDGRVYTTVPGAGTFAGEDVAVQADGKIVVIGGVGFPGDGRSTVSRYNPDGTLDETFTAAEGVLAPGIIETNLVPNDNDGYFGVVIQADGKIVAVGQVGGGSEQNFSVVRYEGTPVPHEPTLAPLTPTIGPNGFTFTAEGSDPDAGDVLTYSLIGAPTARSSTRRRACSSGPPVRNNSASSRLPSVSPMPPACLLSSRSRSPRSAWSREVCSTLGPRGGTP